MPASKFPKLERNFFRRLTNTSNNYNPLAALALVDATLLAYKRTPTGKTPIDFNGNSQIFLNAESIIEESSLINRIDNGNPALRMFELADTFENLEMLLLGQNRQQHFINKPVLY